MKTKAKARAPANEPEPEIEAEEERLSDLQHVDALNDMKNRLLGLNAAIRGLESNDSFATGVIQLADDICDQMEACVKAFDDERHMRMTPEKRAFIASVMNAEA